MCSSVDSGLRWWGDKLLIHCKARTVQCPLSTKKWTTFACGHWSVDLENLSVFYLVPIWVPTHHPATLHLRNWDALQPKHERAKEGKWWIVWAESEITLSHQVPLLCVSSLACLWGGGQRSSSAGLNILFTNTLLDTHTHTTDREHHQPTTCVWFAFAAPHCPSVRCPSFACFTCVCAQCWRHSPLSLNLLCVESEHLRKR